MYHGDPYPLNELASPWDIVQEVGDSYRANYINKVTDPGEAAMWQQLGARFKNRMITFEYNAGSLTSIVNGFAESNQLTKR